MLPSSYLVNLPGVPTWRDRQASSDASTIRRLSDGQGQWGRADVRSAAQRGHASRYSYRSSRLSRRNAPIVDYLHQRCCSSQWSELQPFHQWFEAGRVELIASYDIAVRDAETFTKLAASVSRINRNNHRHSTSDGQPLIMLVVFCFVISQSPNILC
jgi:hypothetical protein